MRLEFIAADHRTEKKRESRPALPQGEMEYVRLVFQSLAVAW